ncbi:hypothetical protein GCM10022209_00230 [Chitinophaga oryziterrae]
MRLITVPCFFTAGVIKPNDVIMKFKVLILLAVAFAGCSRKASTDQNCIKYADVYVTEVQKTATNNPSVSFQVNSGCGQFNKFIQKSEGNTRIIKVQAVYKGCMCTMDMPIRTTTYTFTEKTPGTYYLKFLSEENKYIIDTVVIK